MTAISIFQALSALSWCVPLVIFRKETLRAVRRQASAGDRLLAAVWFCALVGALFPLRWIVFPAALDDLPADQVASWSAIYVLSIASSQFLTWAARDCARG